MEYTIAELLPYNITILQGFYTLCGLVNTDCKFINIEYIICARGYG